MIPRGMCWTKEWRLEYSEETMTQDSVPTEITPGIKFIIDLHRDHVDGQTQMLNMAVWVHWGRGQIGI